MNALMHASIQMYVRVVPAKEEHLCLIHVKVDDVDKDDFVVAGKEDANEGDAIN